MKLTFESICHLTNTIRYTVYINDYIYTLLGWVMTVALRMPTNILVRALWHGLDDTTFVGSFGVAI